MAGKESMTVDRERLGAPGIDGFLYTVLQGPGYSRPAEVRFADRQLRSFRVRAALATNRSYTSNIRTSVADDEGGSFINAAGDIRLDTPSGPYELSRNTQGQLALVTKLVTERSVEQALEQFLTGLTPALDHLAFMSNSPLVIDIVEIRDDTNGVIAASFRAPYGSVTLSQGANEMATALFPAYAQYREALNSDSNFYRFLCFHKILEGVFNQIRPALFRRAREQHISIVTRPDVVPEDAELRSSQAARIGERIHDLYTATFRDQYRHSVAHFALDDGTVTSPSSHRDSVRYAGVIHLAQVCAREVIRNSENFFSQFFAAGGRW